VIPIDTFCRTGEKPDCCSLLKRVLYICCRESGVVLDRDRKKSVSVPVATAVPFMMEPLREMDIRY
jgi:hypothetical protein